MTTYNRPYDYRDLKFQVSENTIPAQPVSSSCNPLSSTRTDRDWYELYDWQLNYFPLKALCFNRFIYTLQPPIKETYQNTDDCSCLPNEGIGYSSAFPTSFYIANRVDEEFSSINSIASP